MELERNATGATMKMGEVKNFRLEDHSSVEKGLFTLVFDMPGEKVNKLDRSSLDELRTTLAQLRLRNDIKTLVLISGKPSIFIAGADIEIIKSIAEPAEGARLAREGQSVIQMIEDMPFPVVAAINGASMGGGTELALCCKYVVVSDNPATKIALPEVNLGVLPGFGGTYRLPRRIGLQSSLDYLLAGKNMSGDKAVKLGFAEAMVPHQNFQEQALRFGARVVRGEVKRSRPRKALVGKVMSAALEENPAGRMVLFSQAKKMIMVKTHGHYPAPLKILEVLAATYGKNREEALDVEQRAFGDLSATEVSKRLIDLFYAMEAVKKQTGVEGYKVAPEDKVQRVGLLGAGVMGGGIAQLAAGKDMPVRMKDIETKALAIGTAASQKLFTDLVRKRRLTRRQAEIKQALISPTTEYKGFKHCDLVIEAVVENMDIKRQVLKETEAVMKDTALFATNTSSLSVTELAAASTRPQNVIGMHFFNPVHKMPLIEVIRGDKTNDRAVAITFDLSKQLGKIPIVVKDGPGFLVNRLLMPYLNEASYLVAEKAPIEELDRAVLKFGMPMGPAALIDEVGIDVALKVGKILNHAFGSRALPSSVNDKLYQAKLLGKKSGKGFYVYDERGKKKELNPEIYQILGTSPVSPAREKKDDWIPRMIYPMINEAAMCLAEGIVKEPQDVDLGMIMGTGFPPFRGGPLRYADSVGLSRIVAKLDDLAKKVSPRYEPSKALREFADKGKFYS